ncbi:hypothetical protein VCHA53O466_320036 [Vibrio chagasii]|nr:hypothetical protein VCHA53O466_320036 [Vibrio chagasii]
MNNEALATITCLERNSTNFDIRVCPHSNLPVLELNFEDMNGVEDSLTITLGHEQPIDMIKALGLSVEESKRQLEDKHNQEVSKIDSEIENAKAILANLEKSKADLSVKKPY